MDKIKIYRTIFKKEIIAEFAIPKKKTNKVVIICGGLPSSPSKKERIELFCKEGFWVFAPRYRGTWESHGEFLKKSPHIDIIDVIDGLSSFVELWSGKRYSIKNPEVYLVGISFGGPAAILNSQDRRVKKVLAISPVIDWTNDSKEEPMGKLGKFVKVAFGRAYNFSDKNWAKLMKGKFYNPITELEKVDGNKIWLFHAKDDLTVLPKPSIKFAKLTGCKLTLVAKGGHGIAKNVLQNKKSMRRIVNFLKFKPK